MANALIFWPENDFWLKKNFRMTNRPYCLPFRIFKKVRGFREAKEASDSNLKLQRLFLGNFGSGYRSWTWHKLTYFIINFDNITKKFWPVMQWKTTFLFLVFRTITHFDRLPPFNMCMYMEEAILLTRRSCMNFSNYNIFYTYYLGT